MSKYKSILMSSTISITNAFDVQRSGLNDLWEEPPSEGTSM